MKSSAIIFGLLALAAGGFSQLADAAMPGPQATAVVSTHDLDLGSAEGRAALNRRLALAAAEVCGDPSSSAPASRRDVRACRVQVVADAEREVALRQAAGRLAAR